MELASLPGSHGTRGHQIRMIISSSGSCSASRPGAAAYEGCGFDQRSASGGMNCGLPTPGTTPFETPGIKCRCPPESPGVEAGAEVGVAEADREVWTVGAGRAVVGRLGGKPPPPPRVPGERADPRVDIRGDKAATLARVAAENRELSDCKARASAATATISSAALSSATSSSSS